MSEQSTHDPTWLRKEGIQRRMKCRGGMAHTIEETFVTVEQLLDAIESDEPLTDINGIGPKTADSIKEWYENREIREKNMSSSSTTRTSSKSLSITFYTSWADALGMEEPNQ